MARAPTHTPATLAECRRRTDEANAKGRADYGPRWGRDILPCDFPCQSCSTEKA